MGIGLHYFTKYYSNQYNPLLENLLRQTAEKTGNFPMFDFSQCQSAYDAHFLLFRTMASAREQLAKNRETLQLLFCTTSAV